MTTVQRFFIAMFVLIAAFIAFVLVFLWLPKATPENLIKVRGTLEDIKTGGENDVVFKLKGDYHTYYINRGLEQGLDIDSLKMHLLQKEIDIYLVKMRFNLISPSHIAKVVSDNKVVYE